MPAELVAKDSNSRKPFAIHHFDRILGDLYGPFVEAFLNDQPAQFTYLMASEFAEKEVTKAAIV
jgi:hypothetical protein